MFPSPCGDELFRIIDAVSTEYAAFPSPCGDELFPDLCETFSVSGSFPSPCGDELFRGSVDLILTDPRFRPLAGMNCFG